MPLKKRIRRITIEVEKLSIINGNTSGSNNFCAKCGTDSSLVGYDEAFAVAGLRDFEFTHFIETGVIHLIIDSERGILVCLASILKLPKIYPQKSPTHLLTDPGNL